ncbi:transmembrane protein [Gossypium australe]|uniref:Transmembrane protein n=1 Tax=Gossypium australe TaxID=47621 RepID=A0A5B6VXP2_9ROSI|nr:transmembrane protein [Gossypium australe]
MPTDLHRFTAEVMACFQAVLTGAQMGFLNVEVEGDCLFVIRNLKENKGERVNKRQDLER